jgi:hypothetical protein
MKVFISSIIGGFEVYRAAAKSAIATLRHQPIIAEDFGAKPSTPQIACLTGIRESDLVVLILGAEYGAIQASGMSATEEEFREARQHKPVFAFVRAGVDPSTQQKAFIEEVESWSGGVFRGSFKNADDLRDGITRALYDYALAIAVGPLDHDEIAVRSTALLGKPDRNRSGSPILSLSIAGGPKQNILRPIEIESASLAEELHQAASFGSARVFDKSKGVQSEMDGALLVLKQEDGARIQLSEDGSISLQLPISQNRNQERSRGGFSGFPGIIEEKVKDRISNALAYASWLMERVDPTQRITHVSIAARIDGSEYMPWATQAEYDASSRSGSFSMNHGRDRKAIQIGQPRSVLRLNRDHLVEDLVVLIRRQWKD